MSGPVRPPLKTELDNDTSENRPVNTLAFANTDFTLSNSGTKTTVAIAGGAGGSIGGSITAGQVAFGATTADSIEGSASLRYDDTNKKLTLIGDSDDDSVFEIIGSDTAAGAGPRLTITNDTGTNSSLELTMDNYAVGILEAGTLGATMRNVMQFGQMSSDSYTVRFNNGGLPANFAVSSDTVTDMLYVDGANDRVGIGTGTPETLLHLETTTISSDSILKIKNTAVPDTTDYATSLVFESTGTPTLNASLLGRIDFNGLDSGGASHNYARIAAVMADKGAGSEDGILKFECTDGGVDFVEHLNMGNGTVTVNDDKKNVIFRVEGDANDSVIRTHATNNNVGIGGIPDAGTALTIFATETPFSTAILRLKNGNTSFPDDTAFGKIEFYNADGNGPGIGASIDALSNGNGAGGWFQFKTGTSGGASTVGMSLDENGVMVVGDYTPLNDVGDDVATIQTDGAISGKLPTILTASGTTTFSPLAHQCRGTSYYFADTGAITMALVSPTAGDNLKIYTPSGGITITMSSGTINGVSSVSRSLATNALLELTCFKDAEYQINNPAA